MKTHTIRRGLFKGLKVTTVSPGPAIVLAKPSPAQALREANERAATEALRRAVAADLARLVASLKVD